MKALFSSVVRFLRWHRRGVAAVAAAACLFCSLSVVRQGTGPTITVLRTTTSIEAGHMLTASDLVAVQVPHNIAPAQPLSDADAATGRITSGPLDEGAILSAASLVDGGSGLPDGEQLVGFRVADADLIALLHVGDRINVIGAPSSGESIQLATGVRVAALPEQDDTFTSGQSGALVVVSADEETASAIAGAASNMRLTIVLT